MLLTFSVVKHYQKYYKCIGKQQIYLSKNCHVTHAIYTVYLRFYA